MQENCGTRVQWHVCDKQNLTLIVMFVKTLMKLILETLRCLPEARLATYSKLIRKSLY